mmetsp:Transcript_15156/g.43980  ORF Transcript_15156/g.43980 Transcript_15156/m.43980 type:complete len:129 (-) Transcript_15156:402-788(-)
MCLITRIWSPLTLNHRPSPRAFQWQLRFLRRTSPDGPDNDSTIAESPETLRRLLSRRCWRVAVDGGGIYGVRCIAASQSGWGADEWRALLVASAAATLLLPPRRRQSREHALWGTRKADVAGGRQEYM